MSSEDPIKVTFIIPARNSGDTIGECLSSIFAQPEENGQFEVLVADNGCTDRTVSIAKEKGATVLEGPSLTVGALRNLGASRARGEILAFVDSDCVIAPNWLQAAISLFDDPRIGAVGAPTSIPENGTWVQRAWYMHRKKTCDRGFVAWLPTENLLVRRDVFQRVGGFNEILATCEDVDLCYRIRETHKILFDSSLKSLHRGEAKTLLQFFRKERWRGKGSFRMILVHGMKGDEIPSMLTPFYGFTVAVLFLVAVFDLVFRAEMTAWAAFAAFLFLPPIMMAIRTSLRVHTATYLFPLILLYIVYVSARTASAISRT
jgi:glycosyltransferase involved in cell wall biosynthesis